MSKRIALETEKDETGEFINSDDIMWMCVNALQWKIYTKW